MPTVTPPKPMVVEPLPKETSVPEIPLEVILPRRIDMVPKPVRIHIKFPLIGPLTIPVRIKIVEGGKIIEVPFNLQLCEKTEGAALAAR